MALAIEVLPPVAPTGWWVEEAETEVRAGRRGGGWVGRPAERVIAAAGEKGTQSAAGQEAHCAEV